MNKWKTGDHYSSDYIATYLTGQMSPRRQARFEQHLAGCSACQRQVKEFRAIQSLLNELPAPRPPRNFALSPQAVPARRAFLWYPVLRSATAAMAAIVLVLFLVGLVAPEPPQGISYRPVDAKPTPLIAPSPQAVAVEPAETRRDRPTVAGQPTAGLIPTVSPLTAYPEKMTPTPWIQATLSRVTPTTPKAPTASGGRIATATAFRATALALLGLLLGLTWMSYRKERPFFS